MAQDPPRLSIILVSYNTCEMTLACLRSVHAETRSPFETIVIDNASADGSAAAIAVEFPDAVVMRETENHGFAKANNLAARRARGEYLLLLNPDTLILDGAIDKLLAFAEHRPEAGIWGGRTLYGDHTLNPSSCWRRMTLWNIICRSIGLTGLFPRNAVFNAEAYGGWDRGSEAEVDIVTGCMLLIRRRDWEGLGGFDTAFVMYGEEADLCLRARKAGMRPRVTPEASIVHYGGASETVRTDKMVRLLKAKTELIKRHVPAWQRPLARAVFAAWPLSRLIGFAVMERMSVRIARRERAGIWRAIWQRRKEWGDGFA